MTNKDDWVSMNKCVNIDDTNVQKDYVRTGIGNHYEISSGGFLGDNITSKIAIKYAENTDDFILKSIFQNLKDSGFTDLYVIDINFIKQAILEKLENDKNR